MNKWQDLFTAAIIGKLVETFLDEGFRIEMSDQDGGGLFMYLVPDGKPVKPRGGYDHWVKLERTNDGASVISNYTVNLESIIAPVIAFAATFD